MIIDRSVLDTERFLIQSYQLNKVHIVQCKTGSCNSSLHHAIRGGTDSPKMTKNQKCQCYQSFLGSVLYLKTGDDFSFCQKVRLTPCTGGPKILTVFGIFIDSGPLGEKQIDEQNGFILVVAVLFLQTDPQTAPRQHRRSLDTLQTPSRHPQDTLQTPSIANRRIKTSFYTLNLFQLLLGGGLN